MRYDIYHAQQLHLVSVTRRVAAKALDIDPCELDYWIEEAGRVDGGDDLTVVETGSGTPAPGGDSGR